MVLNSLTEEPLKLDSLVAIGTDLETILYFSKDVSKCIEIGKV
ncbi:MAG: hypothetical protein E7D28_06705 [Clostridium sp.]|jgi:hypothetical protein|nr:hypothetical protein [Clostridium sp.]MDU2459634.1 hypothetical protein [Clostridium sp.]